MEQSCMHKTAGQQKNNKSNLSSTLLSLGQYTVSLFPAGPSFFLSISILGWLQEMDSNNK